MKKIFLTAMAACAIFASCTKENESASNGTQSIAVQFPEGTVITNTRAALIEDPITPGAAETSLTNPIVFLLNGNSVVSAHDVTASIQDTYATFDDVSSTVNGVLVVANITAAEVTALKAKNSVAEIENYEFTIASQSTTGITGKTLMGKANVTAATVVVESKTYKKVEIELNSLIARFEVGAVKAGEGIVDGSIELIGVWVNSYYTDGTKVAPTTAATGFNDQNSEYWKTTPDAGVPAASAFSTVTFAGSPQGSAYAESFYYSANSSQVILDNDSKAYAFHVFAGANIPHVIMLVKGEYKDSYYSDDKKFFLGWVTFTNYLDNLTPIPSIVPNTIYKIGLGTDGVVIDADKITPKPEIPKFDLAVKCTIAAWTQKTVTPQAN